MKFLIFGLGNFGASLGKKLTAMGHEVLAVDSNQQKTDFFKDKISTTLCLDITDFHAISLLPIEDMDAIIVSVGEDFRASVMSTALLAKHNPKVLISRESSSIHKTVLNAIGISQTINPEYEFAELFAERLVLKNISKVFDLSYTEKIVELDIPEKYGEVKYDDFKILDEYKLSIIAIKKKKNKMHAGSEYDIIKFNEISKTEELTLRPGDKIVLMGSIKNIEKLINNFF